MATSQNGKINRATFERTIWDKVGHVRKEVISGPKYGVDVSVVELPDGSFLVTASDPATLIPDFGLAESAWLTVHLTANDMATTGHSPMYAQFVLNLPPTLTDPEFEQYWGFIHQYCAQLGVAITGGHTGKVIGQHSSFVGGVTMSLVAREVLISSNLRPGLRLLLTKTCAFSACAILARRFPETIDRLIGHEEGQKMRDSFWNLSILEEAREVFDTRKAVALHDVTEGGVLGAVWEMCAAAGCGAVVREDLLPVPEAVSQVASHFGFDPVRSLGSGALLIACKPEDEREIQDRLLARGIPVVSIGHTIEEVGKVFIADGRNGPSEVPFDGSADPYWESYFRALSLGWD
jgi:hydrogenase expression/formation protein HypE